jgi:hypothetical protein
MPKNKIFVKNLQNNGKKVDNSYVYFSGKVENRRAAYSLTWAPLKGKLREMVFDQSRMPNEDFRFLFSSQKSAEVGRKLIYLSNSKRIPAFFPCERKNCRGPELSVTSES